MKKRWLVLMSVLGPLLVLCAALGTALASPGILYVKPAPTGAGNCSSWANACTLQHALKDVASYGDEIWVMTGVYTPATTATDRTASFQLVSGVEVYGGFVGTETSRDQRDWESNVTVLSGDIDGNDTTDPEGVITSTANISGSNSYHVVTSSSVTETCVLDGFHITGGNADGGWPDNVGGGMFNDDGDPTLTNVTFSGNSCDGLWGGGGMYNRYSSPTLTNVVFSGNSAEYCGGMSNDYSNPTLSDVTFSANSALGVGGMCNSHSSPALTNVTFSGNSSRGSAGGMGNSHSSPTLTNVTFSDNTGVYGGGMSCGASSNPTLTNVTFSGNYAGEDGGGMRNGGGSPTLTNVTFTGNSADWDGGGMCNGPGSPTLTSVTFSDNSATDGGGMYSAGSPTLTDVTFSDNLASYGGGMYNDNGDPTLTNIAFSGNSAGHGGGVFNDGGASLTNVIFSGNSATYGGGMANSWYSDPTLTNVTFSGNSGWDGGGMRNYDHSDPTLTNVTFSGNSAGWHGGGMENHFSSSPTLTNSILSGNTAPEGAQIANGDTCTPTISYSLVQDSNGSGGSWDSALGTDGGGNIDADPQLFDADGPDDVVGTLDDNLRLTAASPAIDAGDSTAVPADTLDLDGDSNTTEPLPFDLDGYPRITGSAVDMGAHEFQALLTVSKTVINDGWGEATAADFQAYIDGIPVPWGIAQSVISGTHTVSESVSAGYSASGWSGDCAADGVVTVATGEEKTCYISNDDVAPTVTLTKTVINDDDGAATLSDFQAYLDGAPVAWGVPQSVAPGAYTASESELLGYEATAWGGDCNEDGTITIAFGENAVCSITNDDTLRTHMPLVLKRYRG